MPEPLLATTPEMAAEYARWFVNRRAYTRQSDRPHPESGRHYYYRPRAGRDDGGQGGGERALEPEDIRCHLAGEITLGLYAINPRTQRVKWMAIDADYKRKRDLLIAGLKDVMYPAWCGGAFAKVIEEGEITVGDTVEWVGSAVKSIDGGKEPFET